MCACLARREPNLVPFGPDAILLAAAMRAIENVLLACRPCEPDLPYWSRVCSFLLRDGALAGSASEGVTAATVLASSSIRPRPMPSLEHLASPLYPRIATRPTSARPPGLGRQYPEECNRHDAAEDELDQNPVRSPQTRLVRRRVRERSRSWSELYSGHLASRLQISDELPRGGSLDRQFCRLAPARILPTKTAARR